LNAQLRRNNDGYNKQYGISNADEYQGEIMDTTVERDISRNAPHRAPKTKVARRLSQLRILEGRSDENIPDQGSVMLELQRLATIVEGSDDAIVSKTLEGTVTTWNAGATRIFGYTAEEMIGLPITRILPADLDAEEAEMTAKLTRGERIDRFDTVRLARDGRKVAVSLTVSPLRDAAGNVVGVSKIARDISDRKDTEDALRGANEALRNANEAALQLRVEAENANRAKTEFLAVMSHEIRTPLNSIKGFVDLLTNSTELTPQQRRYVHLVEASNAALLRIVDDILDFSKVEAGRMDLELRPFSLWSLIQDTVAIVAPAVSEKNVKLTVTIEPDVPEWITGDYGRLRQVLLNLLNNAVRFTEEGSINVEVRPRIAAGGRERIFFSVTDTGVGVPAEHQRRLFKPFSQADSSVSRRHGGTGLGLAICKRLVELMDGEIGIVSEVGQGSTFWFTASLPGASEPAREPASERVHDHIGGRKARILVVDDIETNLEIVEAYLRDSGYRVDCVSSGLEAIQLLGSAHFDLILMDVQMPVMNGVTTTQRIRALPAPIGDIPIIAMTANVLPQQVRSFLEAGMNDHVGKPIERAKLYNNVRRWLPRIESGSAGMAPNSSNFEGATFDDFVLVVGAEKARQIAVKFMESLSGAFKSTFMEAQREAHDLINAAGVLGLEGLVTACRRVAELAPSQESERSRVVMKELHRAQSIARQVVTKRLLPKLLGFPLPADAISARNFFQDRVDRP